MEGEIRLEDWAVSWADPDDGYTPPEIRAKVLRGTVYGHPRKGDGESIRTSAIVGVDGTLVKVLSGHRYRLGKIEDGYRAYLDKEGIIYDEKNPIAFGKRAPRRSPAPESSSG